ncbi:MAG: helicase HerA-like domain-containing protein, partial [Chthoniobacterales bacterium]
QRTQIIASSVLAGHYEKVVDRESAFEKLQGRAAQKVAATGAPPIDPGASVPAEAKPSFFSQILGSAGAALQPRVGPRGGQYDSMATSMMKSAVRAAGSQVGRQLIRGLLGGLGGRSR